MVKPDVIVIAHTATSYTLGREGEAALLARLSAASGRRVVTAFGSVAAALNRLGVSRVSLGAPYSAETTAQGKAHLEAHGFEVVGCDNLKGVTNIYDETAERAYAPGPVGRLPGRRGGVPQRHRDADIAGAGDAGDRSRQAGDLERTSAMMWHALRLAGVGEKIAGYGRLLGAGPSTVCRHSPASGRGRTPRRLREREGPAQRWEGEGPPNSSFGSRTITRASPTRRVTPIASRYSSTSIVRLRPTPERSLNAAAVKVPSGSASARSRAISARRATVSGRK